MVGWRNVLHQVIGDRTWARVSTVLSAIRMEWGYEIGPARPAAASRHDVLHLPAQVSRPQLYIATLQAHKRLGKRTILCRVRKATAATLRMHLA